MCCSHYSHRHRKAFAASYLSILSQLELCTRRCAPDQESLEDVPEICMGNVYLLPTMLCCSWQLQQPQLQLPQPWVEQAGRKHALQPPEQAGGECCWVPGVHAAAIQVQHMPLALKEGLEDSCLAAVARMPSMSRGLCFSARSS